MRTPIGNFQLKFALPLLAIATILPWPCDVAYAVPAFAVQTGQPCEACHIGAFGPQLTPFGRAFKIGGYTQGGGQGPEIPLALTAIGSPDNDATSTIRLRPLTAPTRLHAWAVMPLWQNEAWQHEIALPEVPSCRDIIRFDHTCELPGRRFVDPVVEPLVVNAKRLKMSSDLYGPRQQILDGGFSRITDRVAGRHRQTPIDFQMEFHKCTVTCVAGSYVMNGADARARKNHSPNALTVGFGKLSIKQLRKHLTRDVAGVPHDISRDCECDRRIGTFPTS